MKGRTQLSPGLSPRVRGNHVAPETVVKLRGSIPACAGEPTTAYNQADELAVYPRVCGGTVIVCPCVVVPSGLSPRVRGNLTDPTDNDDRIRSIPACAGEPFAVRT